MQYLGRGEKLMTEANNDLNIIKRLLILQLLYSGVPVKDILKVTGMSSKTLYTFIPKKISQTRKGAS